MPRELPDWLPCQMPNCGCPIFITMVFIGFAITIACSRTPSEDKKGEALQVASDLQVPEESSDETEAIRRELLFVKYLGDRAGTSGLDNIRNNQVWAAFLGYKGVEYRVTKLSSIYQVFEPHANVSTIVPAREHDTPGLDSASSWTIDRPTHRTKPMRMLSALFEVSRGDESPIVLHLEMGFVWEDQQWRQMHQFVQEVPTSEASDIRSDQRGRSAPG